MVPQDHRHEKWANLPHERDRLFKLLADTKAAGVVCISGDRHLAELSVMDAGIGYPLFDLTSSGLNQGNPAKWRKLEPNRHRAMTMNTGNNFGVIEIDWSRQGAARAPPNPRRGRRHHDSGTRAAERLAAWRHQGDESEGLSGQAGGSTTDARLVKENLDKQVTLEMTVAPRAWRPIRA